MTAATPTGPLRGLRVLDLTRVLSGPVTTMVLGDMGADVIKVEDPDGGDLYRTTGYLRLGGESVNYLTANRNKRSIALDLATQSGREVLDRLVRTSDVVVENFRPGTAQRLGLDWERLHTRDPRLVYCSITGFGPSGPYRDRAAVDPIIQAMSGVMSLTGEPDGGPVRLGSAVGDLYAAHLAVQGILLALLERQASGTGQRVEVSLLDAAVFGLMPREGEYFATGTVAPRMGSGHPQFVPFQAFETSDGWFYLAVFHDGLWRELCEVLEDDALRDPTFATGAGRVANRTTLVARLSDHFRRGTVDQWLARLQAAGIPSAPINDLDDVFGDPQVIHNEMVVTMQHPTAGTVRLLRNPVRLSATPADIRRPPPRLGEHTDEILVELGLSREDVSDLAARGITSNGAADP